jgi:predicted GH43/DUF377 family glycosyl hydrolase
MWYTGNDGSHTRILSANSTDGIHWSNFQLAVNYSSQGTYDSIHAQNPSVLKDGSVYKMWYSGYGNSHWRILYANSTDGIHWSNFQLAVNYSSQGTYDSIHAQNPSVLKDGSVYKMWYGGYNGSNWRILYANSTDGIHWNNFQLAVNYSSQGSYDSNRAYAPDPMSLGTLF